MPGSIQIGRPHVRAALRAHDLRDIHGIRKVAPLAEGVGFEPTVPCDTTVFETVRFVRSRIPPTAIRGSDQPLSTSSDSEPRVGWAAHTNCQCYRHEKAAPTDSDDAEGGGFQLVDRISRGRLLE